MSVGEIVTLCIAVAGALGVRELIGRLVDRKATSVAVDKTKVETAQTEVQILRDVLAEVREDSREKGVRIEGLESRVERLEERERHALTRAAVHEAWDQMSWQFLLLHNPDHPAPPPLLPIVPPEQSA